jgi:UDP-N-acetylglucosamine transferase subunit ALG13
MIFVTVGTQLPFDRLLGAVAAWHAANTAVPVTGQVADTRLRPPFPCVANLPGPEFDARLRAAELVVSHAGMGTILTCWSLGKPLIVMPRRHDLGEHRNDHQAATVQHLSAQMTLAVARSEAELHQLMDRPWHTLVPRRAETAGVPRISDYIQGLLSPRPGVTP